MAAAHHNTVISLPLAVNTSFNALHPDFGLSIQTRKDETLMKTAASGRARQHPHRSTTKVICSS